MTWKTVGDKILKKIWNENYMWNNYKVQYHIKFNSHEIRQVSFSLQLTHKESVIIAHSLEGYHF